MNEALKRQLLENIKEIKKDRLQLFVIPFDSIKEAKETILSYLTETTKEKGIYVSCEEKYSEIEEEFSELKINPEKIHFVLKKEIGEKETENLSFLNDPYSEVEMSLKVSELADSGEYSFLFFNSIESLLIHKSLPNVQNFINYLTGNLILHEMQCIAISEDNETSSRLTPAINNLWNRTIILTGIA
jgi:hypothetical protein